MSGLIDNRIRRIHGRAATAYLRECVRRRMTARAIARELGTTARTVTKRLRLLGYEPRPWSWRRIRQQRRDAIHNTTQLGLAQISAGGGADTLPATNPEEEL